MWNDPSLWMLFVAVLAFPFLVRVDREPKVSKRQKRKIVERYTKHE